MLRERDDYDVDNRDIRTTWLTLSDETYLEIDPVEIMDNALENNQVSIVVRILFWIIKRII